MLRPAEENHPLNSDQRKVVNTHIPAAYGFHIASPVATFQPHIYLGENADKEFVQDILRTLVTADDSIYNKYFKNKYKNFPVPTVPTDEATHCSICQKRFSQDDVKVIDHCHFTGNFRGISHQNCNINYKDPTFIPIFLHNMSHYDSHLFIEAFSKYPEQKIKPITQTEKSIYLYLLKYL